MLVLRVALAAMPVLTLWVAKLILDTVVALQRGTGDIATLVRYVALEIGIVVVSDLLTRASALVEKLTGDLLSDHLSARLMAHAATIDLESFENPEFYDRLERARQHAMSRLGIVTQLLALGQDVITLATLITALMAYNGWLALLLAMGAVPAFLGETRVVAREHALRFQWTPQRRELNYLSFIGTSDRMAKEVRTFDLGGWLVARYAALAARFRTENRKLAVNGAITVASLSLLTVIAHYGGYAVMLRAAVSGRITVGELTFLAASFVRARDIIQRALLAASELYAHSLSLEDLFVFLAARPRIVTGVAARRVPSTLREGFIFEDVGFRYAGSERWAVRHLDLKFQAGMRIALVGENGAGKTTITKLLMRLYEPTEGRILLDGIDISEYDLESLRREVGVIFQDFAPYAMRLDENIGVGRIERVGSYIEAMAIAPAGAEPLPVPAEITCAAERSLAATLLPRLPGGYRQMLGRNFEGGVALSGGEWQKIALARAYIREAQVLILDEPTAALDARAEYEVFRRFTELVTGKTAILISHRFSTIRMADHVVVLSGGRIVQQGSHDALINDDGLYADLFNLQAAGYR